MAFSERLTKGKPAIHRNFYIILLMDAAFDIQGIKSVLKQLVPEYEPTPD